MVFGKSQSQKSEKFKKFMKSRKSQKWTQLDARLFRPADSSQKPTANGQKKLFKLFKLLRLLRLLSPLVAASAPSV